MRRLYWRDQYQSPRAPFLKMRIPIIALLEKHILPWSGWMSMCSLFCPNTFHSLRAIATTVLHAAGGGSCDCPRDCGAWFQDVSPAAYPTFGRSTQGGDGETFRDDCSFGMQWRPHWDGEAWSCRSLSQVYPCLDEDQLNVLKETLNKIDILTYNAWWYNTHNRRRGAGGRRSCGKKYGEKSSLTYKFMKMHTCVCCSQFGMVHIFDSPMSSSHREY